eukprot:115846_1
MLLVLLLYLSITSDYALLLETGFLHTCVYALDHNETKCFGQNNYGQLGYGDNRTRGDNADEMGDSLLPIDLGASFVPKQMTAGWQHTCALSTTNQVKCWGQNKHGQLGYGDNRTRGDNADEMGDSLLPIDLGASFVPKQMTAGWQHTCALSTTNQVKCWGQNKHGQLGYGDTHARGDELNEMGDSLFEIDLGSSFVSMQIVAGYDHTCALST